MFGPCSNDRKVCRNEFTNEIPGATLLTASYTLHRGALNRTMSCSISIEPGSGFPIIAKRQLHQGRTMARTDASMISKKRH
jgi:hypothetical protein